MRWLAFFDEIDISRILYTVMKSSTGKIYTQFLLSNFPWQKIKPQKKTESTFEYVSNEHITRHRS